jgi:ABC-type multidrug transport system fused ATPase/permease subunit
MLRIPAMGAPERGAAPARQDRPDEASDGSMRHRVAILVGDKRGLVFALAVSSIVSGFTEAATLALLAQVGTSLARGAEHVQQHTGPFDIHASLSTLLAVAFGLTLLRLLLQLPISYLPARIASDVQRNMRINLFHAFTKASWAVQAQDREGLLQETMTSQISQAASAAMQMTSLISASLTFAVLLCSALLLNVAAAGIVLVVGVGSFSLLRPLRALGRRYARALSRSQVRLAGGIAEAVRLAEEAHVFGAGAAQRSRMDNFVKRTARFFFRTTLLAKVASNVYQSLIYVLLVAGLAGLYAFGKSHVAALGAVVLILVRAGTSGQSILGAYQMLNQSMPFIERVQATERRYLQSAPPDGPRRLEAVSTIAFEGVSYSYRAGRPVLSDVSFEVASGEAIGIVGPSGAGKSTLVQLLLGLRTPDGGRYLVNGASPERFSRADWHRAVAYVPQEPRLLHASVADNIRFFRDLDDEALERAAKLARIHDDVMRWSDGYQTIVGPRADAVSGGQQQRICLARALAARPQIVVLDEPTSALDPRSEALIQESLTALKHELTLFIVAHRMSTLDMCDRVMVILDGRLVAFDTQATLESENAYYRSASVLAAGGAGRSA